MCCSRRRHRSSKTGKDLTLRSKGQTTWCLIRLTKITLSTKLRGVLCKHRWFSKEIISSWQVGIQVPRTSTRQTRAALSTATLHRVLVLQSTGLPLMSTNNTSRNRGRCLNSSPKTKLVEVHLLLRHPACSRAPRLGAWIRPSLIRLRHTWLTSAI